MKIRLTGWYVLVLTVILLVFVAATAAILYWQLSYQLRRFAIEDLETVEGLLYFMPNGRVALNEDYHNHAQSRDVQERFLEVFSPEGAVLYRNQRLGRQMLGGAPFAAEGVAGYSDRSIRLADGRRILLVSRRHSMQGRPVLIRLGYSEDSIWSRIREFLAAAAVALPLLLAAAGALGYALAKRAFLPLEQMARRAEQINAERLDQRLPEGNPHDELGRLARVFNAVLDRLEFSFDRLRRFTADASHELRTPLAAIRSVGEVGLQKDATIGESKNTIGSMLEEVGRLTKLVESLLTIARVDAGSVAFTYDTFLVVDLAHEVAALLDVLAEERGQKIIITGDADVKLTGDRILLRQALINILHNALKYSPAGGEISFDITSKEPGISITITDDGPGIAPEHRSAIFERFYRIDAARAREAGGTGLGLAIAKWAVQAQGGTIHAEGSNRGAAFVIRVPVSGEQTK